jgi:NAD(P)-dependent dehydrogenase (short-subunit alcohol dehydrogenase family)
MKKELIIFGASGDLGSAASDVLFKKNYDNYYLFGRNFAKKELRENIHYFDLKDLTAEENVDSAFKSIEVSKDSSYFLLSTIGGYVPTGNISVTEVSDLKFMMDINFITSFLIAKYFVKLVNQAKGGSICFISSINAELPSKNNFAYALSKHSLNYLVKSLAKEGRETNFSVNGIAPGVLDTKKNMEWNKDKSLTISLTEIGEFVYYVFEKYKILSGNLFEMPGTILI